MGKPSEMVGQPFHAAAISFDKTSGGDWVMEKSAWIYPAFYTVSHNILPTDDVPGSAKTRDSQVDYMESIVHGMNSGLDSYLDVRLAILLFRNVYTNEGKKYIHKVAALLLSALEKNPHNIEGWELLFTHIGLTTITDEDIIQKTFWHKSNRGALRCKILTFVREIRQFWSYFTLFFNFESLKKFCSAIRSSNNI